MATTIDELVVTLGLDPKQFNDGQKDALEKFKRTRDDARKTGEDMEASGKVAGQFYANIKREALGLIAVLVGAGSLEKFVASTVTGLSSVQKIATVMGMATPDVIAVAMAVQRIGGNAEAAQQNMLALSQTMERWQRFGDIDPKFAAAISRVHGSVGDTPLQILQHFADWTKGQKPQDVELIGQTLGLNQDLINEAIRGGPQFRKDIQQSYANGIPSDGDIKKVTALQTAFFNLAQTVKFQATESLAGVAGALTKFLNVLNGTDKSSKPMNQLGADMDKLGKDSATLAGRLKELFGPTLLSLVSRFTDALDHQVKALDALVRAATAVSKGDWAGAAGALGDYVKEEAASAFAVVRPAQSVLKGSNFAGAAIGSAATSVGSAVGAIAHSASNAGAVVSSLTSAGYSAAQAEGIAAGLFAESGINPGAVNPTSGAFGIGQWLGKRKQALFAFAAANGQDPNSLALQLRFLEYELSHSEGRAGGSIKGQSSAGGALSAFIRGYERPGPGVGGDLLRGAGFIGRVAAGQVSIGTININAPQAKDAKGIARAIGRHLASTLTPAANTGVN